jgi:Ni/Fe-hydrogenase subunit HybB-like protein
VADRVTRPAVGIAAIVVLLVLALRVISRGLKVKVDPSVFLIFRRVMTGTLFVNLFLFLAEVFTDLFPGSHHAESMRYLLFGAEGHHAVVGWVWAAVALDSTAVLLLASRLRSVPYVHEAACVMAIVGVWIEKGMALVIPGFIPSPLGEIVEYQPSGVELLVCLGVWSFGALVFTLLVRLAARVEEGVLRAPGAPRTPLESIPPP